MSLEGWFLDVQIRDDEAILWVKIGEKRLRLRDRYNVDFYVLSDKVSEEELTQLFDEHDNIFSIEKTSKYVSLDSSEKKSVLRVSVDSKDNYKKLVNLVAQYGEIFDDGLSHTQRYLADKSLIPYSEVRIELNSANRIASITTVPLDLTIEPPPFRVLCFELYLTGDELQIITLDEGMRDEYTFNGKVGDALFSFTEYIEEFDPDMFVCLDSDLKTLLSLQIKHGQNPFGYYHRKSFHLEEGRTHLNLMSYRRMSLAGMVERIQYNREVPRICSNWAAGRAIESRQSYEARRRGHLLPRNGYYQPVMSLEELLRERDHGGLIFSPTVGLHENVGALDFESMFPHLILKDNISYENVRSFREAEGFLLDFTRDTLYRRLFFKRKRKELQDDPERWFWCETRQQALKEILFCTYGYSGCWANKFGNMDTFMEINKSARVNLVKAMNVARAKGFHTIYGNSDSLFLKKEGATRGDFENLSKEISEATGLPITIENHFRYLVLLPQKSAKAFGAINRYYGVRYDGELVCRGIELRRRNTCAFVAETQKEAILMMLSKSSFEEVLSSGVADVQRVISKACRLLKKELVPIESLEEKTIIRRKPGKYKSRLPHVAAAEALEINKSKVDRGDVIRYVYVDSEHKNPFRRVSPAGYQNRYDSKRYIKLVEEAGKSILLPFSKEENNVESFTLESFFNG